MDSTNLTHLDKTRKEDKIQFDVAKIGVLEEGLRQDNAYFKRQVHNKLYLTELLNTIFSINHQVLNILLLDYFDKTFPKETMQPVKLDKLGFFVLRPDREVVQYINNELELLTDLEKDYENLNSQLLTIDKALETIKKEYTGPMKAILPQPGLVGPPGQVGQTVGPVVPGVPQALEPVVLAHPNPVAAESSFPYHPLPKEEPVIPLVLQQSQFPNELSVIEAPSFVDPLIPDAVLRELEDKRRFRYDLFTPEVRARELNRQMEALKTRRLGGTNDPNVANLRPIYQPPPPQVLNIGGTDVLEPISPYKNAVENLRTYCKRVIDHRLQSANWQELTVAKFEGLVEECKRTEKEEWDAKADRKSKLRDYKDSLSRVKEQLRNLYGRRFESDIHAFKLADNNLIKMTDDFMKIMGQLTSDLKIFDMKHSSLQLKERVAQAYNESQHESYNEFFIYNPQWPPFRDELADARTFHIKGNKRKTLNSFRNLLQAIEKIILQHFDSPNRPFYENSQGIFSKISRMFEYMLDRLRHVVPEVVSEAEKDSHQMTLAYVEHYENILKIQYEIFINQTTNGPLGQFIQERLLKSEATEAHRIAIETPFKEIVQRFKDNTDAYETQEFWLDLSMRIYRFTQQFYSESHNSSLIDSYMGTMTSILDQLELLKKEIFDFNYSQMQEGIPKDYHNPPREANKQNITIREVSQYLQEDEHATTFVNPNAPSLIEGDNHDYDAFLQQRYQQARQRLHEVYALNEFTELFRIEPVNNFTKVTFLDNHEEYFLNIPNYFKVHVEEIVIKQEPFVYVPFKKAEKKKADKEHIEEDEPLKTELDREFKYLKQVPEDLKWEQLHSKFIDKLTLEQFINLFVRRRNIVYKNKNYDYVDQILLLEAPGGGIIKEREAVVASIEENMRKGFGYAKYTMSGKRDLPFPIPFGPDSITTHSQINQYLLSVKHLINIVRNISEGLPGSDAFTMMIATDIIEQTNGGVEIKWSCALKWTKSSMIRSIIDSQVPSEVKKNLEKWCLVADEVIRENKPEQERPKVGIVEIVSEVADPSKNPVFMKSVVELNQQAQATRNEEVQPLSKFEQFKQNFAFEKAKQNAIAYGTQAAFGNASLEEADQWELIPQRLKKHDPDLLEQVKADQSFDGEEYEHEPAKLDETERLKGFMVLGIMGLGLVLRLVA